MADGKQIQFQAGIDMNLFGNQLIGMADATTRSMVIKQVNTGDDAATTNVGQFAQDLRKFFKDMTKVDLPELPDQITKLADGIEVSVKQTFMLYQIEQKELDFAFWISVSASLDQFGIPELPLKVDRAYLKLWYTNNAVILKEMQIEDIGKILGSETPPALTKKDAPEEAA